MEHLCVSHAQVIGFFCFFTAAIAETNRLPFDLPEAGRRTGRRFPYRICKLQVRDVLYGEYASMITVSCLATILFFGGWLSLFPRSRLWRGCVIAYGLAGRGERLVGSGTAFVTNPSRKIVLPVLGVVLAGLAVLVALPGANDSPRGPFWSWGKFSSSCLSTSGCAARCPASAMTS